MIRNIVSYFIVLLFCSCSSRIVLAKIVQFNEIDASLFIYKNSSGGATGQENSILKINIGNIKKYKIAEGINLKKMYYEYDKNSNTIVIFHCGGSLTKLSNIVDYIPKNGRLEDIKSLKLQYITDDFKTSSSFSEKCGDDGFYRPYQ